MANEKISQLTPTSAVGDSDDFLLRRGASNVRISQEALRKSFSLEATPWEVAGTAPASVAGSLAATTTTNSLSPTPPLPGGPNYYFSLANSGVCPVDQGGVKSASFTIPAYSVGVDNPFISFMALASSEYALADMMAGLNGGPPTPDSFGVFGIWVSTFSILSVASYTPSGNTSVGYFAVSPGSTVHMDYNPTTGEVTFTSGVDTLTAPFDWGLMPSGSQLQVVAGLAFSVDTPVFTASQMSFDMSDDSPGRSGFVQLAAASLPVGATDGKRYVVQGSGSYAGRELFDGDLVEFHSGLAGIFVTRAADPVIPPSSELTLKQKALLLRKTYGVVQDPSALATLEEGAMAVVSPFSAGGFASFADWSVALYSGTSWVEYPPEDFRKVEFVVDSPDFPQGRVLFYTGSAPEDQLPGASSFMGVNSLPFPVTAPAGYFGNMVNAGWILREPNLGGVTSDWSVYPFPPISDGSSVNVGGTTCRAYALTGGGDINVTVVQDQNISGAFGSSPEFNAVVGVFDLFNDSSLPATVCFEGPGSNGKKFTFHPAEARRFLVMKTPNTPGRVGLTVTPLNRPQEQQVVPESGWTSSLGGYSYPRLLRDGDRVDLHGAVDRVTGGAILSGFPEEFRPRGPRAFPVSVYDSVTGWGALTAVVGDTGGLSVFPDNPTTAFVVFNATWLR